MGLEPKKLALLRILQILQEETDADHPLTQEQIRQKLVRNYGIELERKAIGENLSLLKEAGYEIESDRRRGSFIAVREFDDMEIRVLIDAVLNSRHISEKYSKDLIGKLAKLASPSFRPAVKHIQSTQVRRKTDNKQVFYLIEQIDEAIEKKCRISYNYTLFKVTRQTLEPRIFESGHVSPLELILHNQRYYLKEYRGTSEKGHIWYQPLDRINKLQLLDMPAVSLSEIEKMGVESKADSNTKFLLELGDNKPIRIELLLPPYMVTLFIDQFGSDCSFQRVKRSSSSIVSFMADPESVLQWIMLFGEEVTILSPTSLIDTFCDRLECALEQYRKK